MNTWPSRGLEVLGFEIKVSRQDWLKELKQPEKSQAVQRYCDRWWIVAGHRDIVKSGELPPTWGLMVATKQRLVITVDAPKLSARDIDRPFIASLFRSMNDRLSSEEKSNEFYEKGKADGILAARATEEWDVRRLRENHADLERAVRSFEEETGLSIRGWNYGGGLRHALRLLRDIAGYPQDIDDALNRAAVPLRDALKYIEAIKAVKELMGSGKIPGLTKT